MRVRVSATIDATIDIEEEGLPRESSPRGKAEPAPKTGPTSVSRPRPRSHDDAPDDMDELIFLTLLPPPKPKPKPEE